MKAAPARLTSSYGTQVVEPFTRATFLDPWGAPVGSVDVHGGTYVSTAARWPRDEAELEVPVALRPGQTSPPVSPYGGRLLLEVGARVPGVGELLFPLASLDVCETTIERPESVVRVRAVSHEARVNEHRHMAGETTAAGLTSAVVTGLVRRTLGASWPVRNLLTTDPTLEAGRIDLDTADVWDAVEQLMDAAGAEAIFDASGALVLRPVLVKAATPVQTFRTGESGTGTVTGYTSVRGWGPNVVALIWEDANDARRVGIWQDTSAGPSSVSGPYGRHVFTRTYRVKAGALPTQAHANAAAVAMARRQLGAFRTVGLRVVPAPWVEPGDTVRMEFLGGRAELLQVTGLELDLTQLDVMRLDCRDYAYTATP